MLWCARWWCGGSAWAGRLDVGLVAGVTLVLASGVGTAFAIAGMTSPKGRSHTFDERADGYCRGEGCSAFLLQSTAATGINILGSAVQQDGPSASLTAPNGLSQTRLIESVQCGRKGVSSLEAHGTGTALGDPIEVCYYLLPIQ